MMHDSDTLVCENVIVSFKYISTSVVTHVQQSYALHLANILRYVLMYKVST